jgi:hypothetical protein
VGFGTARASEGIEVVVVGEVVVAVQVIILSHGKKGSRE